MTSAVMMHQTQPLDYRQRSACRLTDGTPGSQCWQYGPWSQCSRSCGIGSTNRTAICSPAPAPGPSAAHAQQAPLPSKAMSPSSQQSIMLLQPCDSSPGTIPAHTVDQCSIASCDLPTWELGEWSTCNATCGGAILCPVSLHTYPTHLPILQSEAPHAQHQELWQGPYGQRQWSEPSQ